MYESLLLNKALQNTVTVALMRREDDDVLATDYIDESKPAENLIFVEHDNYKHWKAVRVLNFGSFHVDVSNLEEFKVNADFSKIDESATISSFDEEYTTPEKRELQIIVERESPGGLESIYRAVYNGLVHLKQSQATPSSERLRERFVRFQVVKDLDTTKGKLKDQAVNFIKYLAGNAVVDGDEYDNVVYIEKSLDGHVRINLHNHEGIVPREGDADDKFRHVRDLEKGSVQEIYLLAHVFPKTGNKQETWSAIKYEGRPSETSTQSSVLETDTDQAYVDADGYMPGLVPGVISGIFDGALKLKNQSPPPHVMGFLSDIGDCNLKDIAKGEMLQNGTGLVQCGILKPELVDGNTVILPELDQPELSVWKTLAGRQLNRFDIGSFLVRASILKDKQQGRPLVTAYFMGNGPVFWRIVINDIRDEEVFKGMHTKLNQLDDFEKKVVVDEHERQYHGVKRKLEILVNTLEGIGTASACRYDQAINNLSEINMRNVRMPDDWLTEEKNKIEAE